jgi:hypothetical protein
VNDYLQASEVTEGDFLTDLDNGYVYDVEHQEYRWVVINFHTAEGAEASLSVPDDLMLRVKTGEPA